MPSIIILYFSILRNIKKILIFNKDKYISKRLSWKVSFDYSNNNWKFEIGQDTQFFELKFSKASDTSIHIYSDPSSIDGIAIASNKYSIEDIKDASIYDMSSRTRTPQKWEIIILKNKNWNYCALKILDIKDRTRSDKNDEVTFKYLINSEWYKDFRN